MCDQNTSNFDPNFDPCVIKIRRNSIRSSIHMWLKFIEIRTKCGFSNVLEVLLSSAFVSCGRLWSALVRFGRLRSALASLGPFWSTLIEILVWISCSEVAQISCPIWSLVWSDLIIWYDLVGCHQFGILDQISCSHFLFKFLDQISWPIFTITLCSAWFEFLSNCLSDPISDLSLPDHLIWSDWNWSDRNYWSNFLITFHDQVCWSNLLIHLSDHDIFSYRSLQISRSTLLVILSDQFPFCSDPFFTAFKFLVQICWSSFRSCAFFFWPFF